MSLKNKANINSVDASGTGLYENVTDLARARFEDFEAWSKRAVTLISGLRIKKGVLRKIPIQLVDIARTIADFVGFPIPTRSEGNILCDLLE